MGPSSFNDSMLVGIVVGGHDADPASDHSGGMRIIIPGLHGPDVQTNHLAFSSMQKSPTNYSQQSFEGTLDPGTCVFVRKDTGSNMCHIIGMANEIYDPNGQISGNFNLLSIPQIAKAIQQTIDVRIPPTIQETTEKGVKIRKKQEKGENHKHALLANIPSNGAIYPLAGSIVPNVKNVSTAIEAFSGILTPSIAGLLPGINVSLGNLIGSLTSGNLLGSLAGNVVGNVINQIGGDLPGEIVGAVGAAATKMISQNELRDLSKQLTSKLNPEMRQTLNSMSLLLSTIETTTGGGFTSGGKVDPLSYMSNAVDLLGQTRQIGDMIQAFQQLQYDTSLFGQDKLPNITIMIDTPFGKVPLSISPTGIISKNIPAPLQQLINSFVSQLTSASGFPGVNPGENLFGDSAKTMFDMFQRLSPQAEKVAIELSRTLNQNDVAKTFDRAVKKTVQGGSGIFGTLFRG
jgi:hypothetical protein